MRTLSDEIVYGSGDWGGNEVVLINDVKEFIKNSLNIKCPIKEDCMANKYRVQGFKIALLEFHHNTNKFAGDVLVATDVTEDKDGS